MWWINGPATHPTMASLPLSQQMEWKAHLTSRLCIDPALDSLKGTSVIPKAEPLETKRPQTRNCSHLLYSKWAKAWHSYGRSFIHPPIFSCFQPISGRDKNLSHSVDFTLICLLLEAIYHGRHFAILIKFNQTCNVLFQEAQSEILSIKLIREETFQRLFSIPRTVHS